MRNGASIAVIIPAFNEEASIGKVISAIPDWVDDIIVGNNGSTDRTAEIAHAHGARVVLELRRGYGAACLAAMDALNDPDVVVFLDGDFSDHPEEMHLLVDPIVDDRADMVIGSRTIGSREAGALTPQALFGNWLSCILIRWLWAVSYSDLGPFRAIRYEALERLRMRDRDYGWTVEMQIKAARESLRTLEVPVSYRKRIGKSKVSGTVRGVIGAGTKILATIFRAAIGSLPGEKAQEHPERLIVFTRYPEPGRTKTRLIPTLGPEGASELHRRMVERTVACAKELSRRRPVSLEVRYDGGGKRVMSAWLGGALAYRRQSPGDLGLRMHEAFVKAFERGAERVVLVGTDCPAISADIFADAFDALGESDVVLGPATDGGYYLIGLKKPAPRLFAGMRWGTENVFRQTMQAADEIGLSAATVAELDDVDLPEDLHAWERETGHPAAEAAAPSISVVIPTLNEAAALGDAIASAKCADGVEIIVADGGSADDTVEAASSAGARVVVGDRGRGRQMNAGAAAATGDVLLFLHADTRLPENYHEHVRNALIRPGIVAGAFRLGIDSPNASMRFIAGVANFRSTRLHMPYGDQALFLRAEIFGEMGGFPEIPIMEDCELVRRLNRRGKIEIAPASVRTSPRRWLATGAFRTTLKNQAAVIAYFMGIPISIIAEWYHGGRKPRDGEKTV